jgi:mannose-6-phosphate isomerase-like protein (cupin superfamily)
LMFEQLSPLSMSPRSETFQPTFSPLTGTPTYNSPLSTIQPLTTPEYDMEMPGIPTIQLSPAENYSLEVLGRAGRGYNPRINYEALDMDATAPGFDGHIESLTQRNTNFRTVLFTSDRQQLVAMSLKEGEDIGMETHASVDQFFRIETGYGVVIMNGKKQRFDEGSGFIVPAGVRHNVIAETPVKLYTIYSPPNHPFYAIDVTKQDALNRE